MITKNEFCRHAEALLHFCEYPAVQYKVMFSLLDTPYQDEALSALRRDFLKSDIVEEMYQTQDINGGWGKLRSKDYSVKAKIPTSGVGIERCLYIGLTIEDRDILFMASEYLQELLRGTGRVYEEGEYSYERDKAAQHEVFLTREDRLVPMQSELLLKRRQEVPESLEGAMLRHLGQNAYENGYFWEKTPDKLPDSFVYKQTRRWFKTFNYINQFRGSKIYLENAVEWLLENAREDGLWDWGTQVKDPWGYFGYFSCNRNYGHNRVVDCTIEVLSFLKLYMENNDCN